MVRYENCIKVHKSCGGIVKWLESLRPGVGFYGKCVRCERQGIVIEDIIPLDKEYLDEPNVVLEHSHNDTFKHIAWDQNDSWEENQERLSEQVMKEIYS